jgi:hypothetical protein
MKKLLIGLTLLTSMSASAYNCENALTSNTESTLEIVQMTNLSEAERSVMLEISINTRNIIELGCGLREAKKIDPLAELEESRQEILIMEGISDAERSIMLENNSNIKRIIELSL